MAITLQIKKSTASTSPPSLADGELAYSHGAGTQANNGKRFFIGDNAGNITVIGGQYFTDMLDHVHGTLSASSAIITDSSSRINDLIVGTSSTDGGSIKLREAANNGTSSTSIKSAAALGGDITFTLPSSIADGSFMMSNASGALSNTTFNTTGGVGVADFAVAGNVVSLSPTPSAFETIIVDNIKLGDADAQTISTSSGDLKLNPAVDIDAASNVIKNVGTPQNPSDAATKLYVDNAIEGLDVKGSVVVASVGNVAGTYNNGAGTITAAGNGAIGAIDGITLAQHDRVLLKDQTNNAHNGIYKVTTVGDGSNPYVLTRTDDFDSTSNITPNSFVFIEKGTVNDNRGYVMTADGTITIGSTNLTWTQFSGAAQISAGSGLTGSSTFDVNVDGTTLEISSNQVQVKNSGITAAKLANSSVDLTGSDSKITGTLGLANGGLGITAANVEQGSVFVSNNGTSITALDPNPGNATGNANKNKILFYTGGNTGTMGFVDAIDGGTYT